MFGILAILSVIAFSFLLASPAPTNAEGMVSMNNPAVEAPAMLSSPSSANFALSPVTNGEIVESAPANWINAIGAIVAILLMGLVLLVLLKYLLAPFAPLFKYVRNKLLGISGDTDREEVITHYHIHRAGQSLSSP
ncbi:MAG TPA: hypothetical protein VJ378_02105 [Candidatus Paceibacterota bacterium]|nr:hypothetical protein [Candidatus Paceibacterota bacterium]